MKRAVSLLLAAVLALAIAAPASAGQYCRRFRMEGQIKLTHKNFDEALGPGRGLVLWQSTGQFHIDLIFPDQGGEPIGQDNWVKLIKLETPSHGTAKPCAVVPQPGASDPRPFTLWAELTPYNVAIEDAQGNSKGTRDQLDFRLKTLPPLSPIIVEMTCAGPPAMVNDHGVTYNQLLLPFHLTLIGLNLRMNQEHESTMPPMDIFDKMNAELSWVELQTMVPCENFKY